MDIKAHKYLYYIFLAVNYLWIIGAGMAMVENENSSNCDDEEKKQTMVILYGSLSFFVCGFFHSIQRTCYYPNFLKLYNWVFVLFSFAVMIMGVTRILKTLNKTTVCHNLKFMDDFVTFSYIISFGTCFSYILMLLLLELIILLFYGFKCLAYSFCNCCCNCYTCIFAGVEGKKFVFVAPTKRPTFLKYIKVFFKETALNDRPDIIIEDQIKNQSNISNLSEAEKKKILFSL